MLNGIDKIDGLTPEQIEAVNGLAGGLINKKTELEEKLSKAKGSLSSEESAQEKLRILEANIERQQLESKENYQGALTLKENEYNNALEKLKAGTTEKDALIHKLLVDNGLNAQLVQYDVSKDLMPLIQQALSAQATIVDGQAMIGEQSLSEFMKVWAESPQGKASRVAASNLGGNGSGGGGGSTKKQMKDMSDSERLALLRENPTEFNRLKAEA
mgnify:FL=1|tara:strand:- start:325 stop:969 length:645 start_codon:yes stop_codon:yes gene_type:complete